MAREAELEHYPYVVPRFVELCVWWRAAHFRGVCVWVR